MVESVRLRTKWLRGSNPTAITQNSDTAPVLRKGFRDIHATIECRFTLKRVRHMIITYNGRRKPTFLLNYLRNFNEIFKKDVDYDNIKSHKKSIFTVSLENTFFKKSQRGGQIDLPRPAFLWLIQSFHL